MDSDLAGYRLYQAHGVCANNPGPFVLVKTFGVINYGLYAVPSQGTYCYQLRAFDQAGKVSPHSNRAQLR